MQEIDFPDITSETPLETLTASQNHLNLHSVTFKMAVVLLISVDSHILYSKLFMWAGLESAE